MVYVALLRGINVGGNNKVDMKKLKAIFESLGYANVVTYINSGNIVFEESSKEKDVIIREIEDAIKRNFQIDIRVLVKSFEDIRLICNQLPDAWVKSEVMRTDVMFLWDDFDRPEILQQLKMSPLDNVKYAPGAVLWNVEYKDYTKSGISKLIGTEIFRNMTVRNVNTVRKLYQIMEKNCNAVL